jgi:hypothetical protein
VSESKLFAEALDRYVDPYPALLAQAEEGRDAMKRSNVVVCGLARDLEPLADLTLARIERLTSYFAYSAVVLYENDSKDGTTQKLLHWASLNSVPHRRLYVTTESHHRRRHEHVFNPDRMRDMAWYRSKLHAKTMSLEFAFEPDYVIALDTDYHAGWSWRGLESVFGAGLAFDAAWANGIRFAPEPRPPWRLRVRMFDTAAYRDARDKSNLGAPAPRPDAAWLEATSAFGGVGVYRWQAWRDGTFDPADGERASRSCECEHVQFHRSMRAVGHTRTYIVPALLTCHSYAPNPAAKLLWEGSSALDCI